MPKMPLWGCVQVNEIYETFKNAGRSPILIGIIGTKFLLVSASSFLSASLIFVILANKELRGGGPFHKLVLYNALNNVLTALNPMITFIVVASGQNFIPLLQCLQYQALSLFFSYCQHISFLFIGLDRLMATLFPLWHKKRRNPFAYLFLLILFSLFYPSLVLFYSVDFVLAQPQEPVMCSGPDCSPSNTFYWTWAVNGASLLCYVLLGIILKFWRTQHAPEEFTRRIFKSLALMLLLELFGWFAYSCLRLALSLFANPSQTQQWFIFQIASWLLILILGLNPVVLFLTSSDYRAAYLAKFKWLRKYFLPISVNSGGNSVATEPTGPWMEELERGK